jgi:kumamolisin
MSAVNAMNSAITDAARLGVSVFVAAGDHLATDGLDNGKANVDFPASSPWAIGCGGTQIDTSGSAIVSEVVWNEGADGWGTGGGISDYFAVPAFQSKTPLPRSVNGDRVGRGVPDVAGDASSLSPYSVVLNGAVTPIGGTSAVAPLWAALTALLNESRGSSLGFFLPTLYASPTPMREILKGDNKPVGSKLGYDAGPRWNACTGLGVPTDALEAHFKPKVA